MLGETIKVLSLNLSRKICEMCDMIMNACHYDFRHTKNIERAVTLSQQDAVAKKDQQGSKILELSQKLSSFQEV